jgi:hypothetical protein
LSITTIIQSDIESRDNDYIGLASNNTDAEEINLVVGDVFLGIQSSFLCGFNNAVVPPNSEITSAVCDFFTDPLFGPPQTGAITCDIKAPDREAGSDDGSLKYFPFYGRDTEVGIGWRFHGSDTFHVHVKSDVGGTIADTTGVATTRSDPVAQTSGINEVAQKFTVGTSVTLGSVDLTLARVGTGGGNWQASIVAPLSSPSDGSIPGNQNATVFVRPNLAISDVVVGSTISTSETVVTFSFSGDEQVTLPAGDYYVRLFKSDGDVTDSSNYLNTYLNRTFLGSAGMRHTANVVGLGKFNYPVDADILVAARTFELSTSVAWVMPDPMNQLTRHSTPSLAVLVQEIVDDPGYIQGNHIALNFTATGETNKRSLIAFIAAIPALGPRLHITYKPAPTITLNLGSISQGVTVNMNGFISADSIEPAQDDADLVLDVTGVTAGQFELTTDSGTAITQFTQGQIDSSLVVFVPDGTNVTPAWSVQATDDIPLKSNVIPAIVIFTALDPSLDVNQLTLIRAATVSITAAEMLASDTGQDDADLIFTVSSVTGGQFERVSASGIEITTWTQSEVTANDIVFIDDGNVTAPSYDLSVTNNASLFDGPDAATITFTAPLPVISTNQLTLVRAETVLITAAEMQASDLAQSNSTLVFTVSSVSGGQFERVSAPSVAITTWNQSEVTASDIVFIDNDDATAPSYDLLITNDASQTDGPDAATITFTTGPTLVTNQLTLTQGQTVGLTSNVMRATATDADQDEGDLIFTISSLTNGQFQRLSAPGIVITTWTQSEVTAGDIVFIDDDDRIAPAYDLSVTNDESVSDGPFAATITFSFRRWTEVAGPSRVDKYEWRLPNNDQLHVEQTVGPGDLLIKPEDISLKPTKSPKRSGIQHGQDDWDFDPIPVTRWYVASETVMPGSWTDVDGPTKLDKYEWRLPNNGDQHGEQTVAPGDLLIKPSQLELVPTKSPKRSGIQHGQDDWNFNTVPDTSWYTASEPLVGGWTRFEGPAKVDKYEWRLPENKDEHVEQTVAPGDLLIKPEALALKPTKSPKRSGIQHGADDWNFTNVPDTSWYAFGMIEDL